MLQQDTSSIGCWSKNSLSYKCNVHQESSIGFNHKYHLCLSHKSFRSNEILAHIDLLHPYYIYVRPNRHHLNISDTHTHWLGNIHQYKRIDMILDQILNLEDTLELDLLLLHKLH